MWCKQVTAIWKCQNLQRNVWPSGRRPTQSPPRMPYISLLILTFFKSLYLSISGQINTKLEILWILMCSLWLWGSIVVNPIIYRLVPSPSRFEIRQYKDFSLGSLCPWEKHVSSKGLLRYKREIRSISTTHCFRDNQAKIYLTSFKYRTIGAISFPN